MRKVAVSIFEKGVMVDKGTAFFHGFSIDVDGGEVVSAVQYPVAIIEFPDGHVETVRPERIRFLTPPEA